MKHPETSVIQSDFMSGSVEHCSCGSVGDDGHTFGCIMDQMARKKAALPNPRIEEAEMVDDSDFDPI